MPIHAAVFGGNLDVVNLLADAKADVTFTVKTNSGQRCVERLCQNGIHSSFIWRLLQLWLACDGTTSGIKSRCRSMHPFYGLFLFQADVSASTKDDYTALHYVQVFSNDKWQVTEEEKEHNSTQTTQCRQLNVGAVLLGMTWQNC